MKKIKSVFIIAICFVLALSFLGCTSQRAVTDEKTPAPSVPETPELPADKNDVPLKAAPSDFSFAADYEEVKAVLAGTAPIDYCRHPQEAELFGEVSVISPDAAFRPARCAYSEGLVYTIQGGSLIIYGETEAGFDVISETFLFSESLSEGGNEADDDYIYSTETPRGIYISGSTAAVLTSSYTYAETFSEDSQSVEYSESRQAGVILVNISDPSEPVVINRLSQDGVYCGAGLWGENIFIITSLFVNGSDDTEDIIPSLYAGNEKRILSPEEIIILPKNTGSAYTFAVGYSTSSASTVFSKAVLGGLGRLYITDTAAYMVFSAVENSASGGDNCPVSDVIKIDFSLNSGICGASVAGYTPESYSFGENEGSFYMAASGSKNIIYSFSPDFADCNAVYALIDEEILSVKFLGSTALAETVNGTAKIEADGSWEVFTALPIPGRLYELGGGIYAGTVNDDGGGAILTAIDSHSLTETAAIQLISDDGAFFSGGDISVCPEMGLAAVPVGNSYQIYRYTESGFSLCASVPVSGRQSDLGFIFDGDTACVYSGTVTVIDLADMSVKYTVQATSQNAENALG